MDNDETVPVEGYKCITQFKRQNVRAGVASSFKLAASDSRGDICAAGCLVNGQKARVVTVCISPNNPSDDWKSDIFKLGRVFSKSMQNV
jgi:hypothetical protein